MTEVEPRLVDTGRGYTITYRGKTLYSPRDPRAGAIRRVEKITFEPKTLVFIPSLGLGYGIPELLDRIPDSCHILCIEVDERLFKLALSAGPALPKSNRLTIIRTAQPKQAAAVAQKLGLWRFRRLLPLHLSGGYQLYRREYRELQEILEEEIRLFWQNKLTLVTMAHLWLKNLFTNLRFLPAAGDISELSTNRPMLVAGAGPSLEKSLDWIARIRKQIILMAVDTSLPVLSEAGLLPDWVFTLDAQIYTVLDFIPCRDPRIKLLCDLTSNPQSLRLFPELFFFSTRFHPLQLFDRLEAAGLLPTPLHPRGSVGVSAVEAALLITKGPVLFTGLDFSYPRGQPHARGAPSQRAMHFECTRTQPCGMSAFEALLARPRLWLDGKRGKRLLTDLVLHSYARQLHNIIAGSPRTFDLGPEGLPVGAQKIHSFSELAQICIPSPSRGSRGRIEAGRRSARDRKGRVGQVRSFCENEQSLVSEVVQKLAEPGRQEADRLHPLFEAVEYLLLSLPEVNPEKVLTSQDLKTVNARARLFSSHMQRTCKALVRCGP